MALSFLRRRLLAKPDVQHPDAVFVVNDYMVIETLSLMRSEHDLRVPDDVAIIGVDDFPPAAMPELSLTILHQTLEQMEPNTVRLMIKP